MKNTVYIFLSLLLAAGCQCGHREQQIAPEQQPEILLNLPAADGVAAVKAAATLPEEPYFDIVTNLGTIRVRLYKDTPRHRDNFEKLALGGYYDSLLFHRVINHFMIQGGDPFTRDTAKVAHYGEGGPSYNIPAEMRDAGGEPLHRHIKGALAAARRGDLANPYKESSGSQFYLVQDPENCTHLDGEYTVFGETVAGLGVIDRIAAQPTDRYDRPLQPVVILRIRPNEEMNSKEMFGTELANDLAE